MTENKLVFVGIIISSKSLSELSVHNGYIAVDYGKITKLGTESEYEQLKKEGVFDSYKVVKMSSDLFLMPGFVDCHTHAAQFPNIGLGLDLPLLEWLNKYTFPLENQYGDIKYAASIYNKVVRSLLINGTTTASYFASIHLGGTLQLAQSVINNHQRAFVGKVSMNIENDAGYYNETKKDLEETENFIKAVLDYKNDLVQPIISPRFAVSCDSALMAGLSELSDKYECRIQSHISENVDEIKHVLNTFPCCKHYTDVYDQCRILNQRCIMAHAVHLSMEETATLANRGVSIAHCPASNTRLMSGLCPVRKYLESGVVVGLGTDVAGGDNATILDAMRRTMDVSAHLELMGQSGSALSWSEVFYLATLGGAKALKLDHKIGSFEVGKEFDALLINVYETNGPIVKFGPTYNTPQERALHLLQKFIYVGDDRNIAHVYVKGHKVKDVLEDISLLN
ncbi:hypothetical protein ACJJTC_004723 [Scirpophaga incertulas]